MAQNTTSIKDKELLICHRGPFIFQKVLKIEVPDKSYLVRYILYADASKPEGSV